MKAALPMGLLKVRYGRAFSNILPYKSEQIARPTTVTNVRGGEGLKLLLMHCSPPFFMLPLGGSSSHSLSLSIFISLSLSLSFSLALSVIYFCLSVFWFPLASFSWSAANCVFLCVCFVFLFLMSVFFIFFAAFRSSPKLLMFFCFFHFNSE